MNMSVANAERDDVHGLHDIVVMRSVNVTGIATA